MGKIKVDANKIRKLIILLAIVVVVIIIAVLILLTNSTENRLRYIYNEKNEGNIELMPLNVSPLFVEYTGRVNQRSIYKAMYLLVDDVIQEYYKDFKGNFNEDYLSKYYDKNTEKVRKDLGIIEKDEFIKFATCLKDLQSDKLKLEEYIIVPDSITKTAKGVKFVLIIKYEGNSKIALNLEILNNEQTTKTPINCFGGVEEKYLDYEYEKNTTNEVEIEGRPGKVIK